MDMTKKETLAEYSSNAEFGFYAFHEDVFRQNIRNMKEAFSSRYKNFQLAYSFKTNYLKRICEICAEEGVMAEVVSPQELRYAKELGFRPGEIIYNGIIPDTAMKLLVSRKGYVNIDNLSEYMQIANLARNTGNRIRIGVRVNLDVGQTYASRFGMSRDGSDFRPVMNDIAGNPDISLAGFHCHIGSCRQLPYWKRKSEEMAELALEYGAEYLDMGGGMFGPMPDELASQFSGYVGSYEEYAEAVAGTMKKYFPDETVKLILEPGTALVGNTMDVYARVENVKTISDQMFITVNCNSGQLGMICDCRDIPVEVMQTWQSKKENGWAAKDAIIAGNTCLEFDYIKKGFSGTVRQGDIMIFRNIGAYSISSSRQFIVPRLAVYDYETLKILRAPESYEDMMKKYLQ